MSEEISSSAGNKTMDQTRSLLDQMILVPSHPVPAFLVPKEGPSVQILEDGTIAVLPRPIRKLLDDRYEGKV